MTEFNLATIGIAHTPFQEKFAIPRQANLLAIPAKIELLPPYNTLEAVAGLEQVSHIWLSFIFDQHLAEPDAKPRLSVRPPRLGGNKKLGVFATRSSFRPNALGQSLLRLCAIEQDQQRLFLHVEGIDVLDQTAVVDIKPYVPYADCVDAHNGIAPDPPTAILAVRWSHQALAQLQQLKGDECARIQEYITGLIALDPRPAYKQQQTTGDYAMAHFDVDVHWQMYAANHAQVTNIYDTKNKE